MYFRWISQPVEIFTELDPQNHQEKDLHHFCRRLFQVLWTRSSLTAFTVDATKDRHGLLLCLTSHSNGGLCQCGGARDAHASVALGDYFGAAIINHWDSAQHSSESPTDAFGELQFAGSSKRHSYVGVLFVALESLTFQCWLENVNFLTFSLLLNRRRAAKEGQAPIINAHACSIFGTIYLSFFPKLVKHLLLNKISVAVPAAVLGHASIYGLHLDDSPLGASCS